MRPVFDPALALRALMGAHALEALHQIVHGAAYVDSLHKRKASPKPVKKLGRIAADTVWMRQRCRSVKIR